MCRKGQLTGVSDRTYHYPCYKAGLKAVLGSYILHFARNSNVAWRAAFSVTVHRMDK